MAPTHQTADKEQAVTKIAVVFCPTLSGQKVALLTLWTQQLATNRLVRAASAPSQSLSTDIPTVVMIKQHFLNTFLLIKPLLTKNMSDKKLQMALVKRQSINNKTELR